MVPGKIENKITVDPAIPPPGIDPKNREQGLGQIRVHSPHVPSPHSMSGSQEALPPPVALGLSVVTDPGTTIPSDHSVPRRFLTPQP